MDVLPRTTEKLSLDWPDEPCESQSSKLDERFLSGSGSRPARRKLPFFPDLHHEISRSWKQPFSSSLTNAAAADFTSLVGSVEQGYAPESLRCGSKRLGRCPLGRHRLVSSFMRGVKRLRPVHPPSFPSWDLSVVLKGVAGASF